MLATAVFLAGEIAVRKLQDPPLDLNSLQAEGDWTARYAHDDSIAQQSVGIIPLFRFNCWAPGQPFRYSREINRESNTEASEPLALLLNSHNISLAITWNGRPIGPLRTQYYRSHVIRIPPDISQAGPQRIALTEIAGFEIAPHATKIHLGRAHEITKYRQLLEIADILWIAVYASLFCAALFAARALERDAEQFSKRALIAFSAYCLALLATAAVESSWLKPLLFSRFYSATELIPPSLNTVAFAAFAWSLLPDKPLKVWRLLRIALSMLLAVATAAALLRIHAASIPPEFYEYSHLITEADTASLWKLSIALCGIAALIGGSRTGALLVLLVSVTALSRWSQVTSFINADARAVAHVGILIAIVATLALAGRRDRHASGPRNS